MDQLTTLKGQVAELSEQMAVLKAQLMDERWQNVARSLETINANFVAVNERLARLERGHRETIPGSGGQ